MNMLGWLSLCFQYIGWRVGYDEWMLSVSEEKGEEETVINKKVKCSGGGIEYNYIYATPRSLLLQIGNLWRNGEAA